MYFTTKNYKFIAIVINVIGAVSFHCIPEQVNIEEKTFCKNKI